MSDFVDTLERIGATAEEIAAAAMIRGLRDELAEAKRDIDAWCKAEAKYYGGLHDTSKVLALEAERDALLEEVRRLRAERTTGG